MKAGWRGAGRTFTAGISNGRVLPPPAEPPAMGIVPSAPTPQIPLFASYSS